MKTILFYSIYFLYTNSIDKRLISTKYQDATPSTKSYMKINYVWLMQSLGDIAKYINKVEGYFTPINSLENKKRNEVLVQIQAIRAVLKELKTFVNPTDAKLPPLSKAKVLTNENLSNNPTRNTSPLLRSPRKKQSSNKTRSFLSGTVTPLHNADRESSPETNKLNDTTITYKSDIPKLKFNRIQIQTLTNKIENIERHNHYLKKKKKYYKTFDEQWKNGYPQFKQHLLEVYCKLNGIVNNGGIELTFKKLNREKIYVVLQSLFTRLMTLWKMKRK
eukprot:GAHX01001754.1.p1 GENE.GAHX01001754.1~~GAHX01001754.1.p1  ORF type:complete len:276 (-),score=44.15 GAHX01001754.1:26-853(-)